MWISSGFDAILILNKKIYEKGIFLWKGGENMKKLISSLIVMAIALVGLSAAYSPAPVKAADANQITATSLGLYYGEATGLGTKDIRSTIAQIIKVAMGLLGIVAVVIILIGGFTWMTAGGNEDKVGEAKKWIFSGVIGLALILSAYALAQFIITNLVEATTTTV